MEIELYQGERAFTAELTVDPETGEVMGGEYLELLVKRNPVGTVAYVLNQKAQKQMIDERIKQLQALSKSLENNTDRVKESLKQLMQYTGVNRIESDDKTFKAVLYKDRDKSIEVFDEKQLPADYLREIPARYEPDKTLIKKAITDGFEVPGAKIVAKDRLELK